MSEAAMPEGTVVDANPVEAPEPASAAGQQSYRGTKHKVKVDDSEHEIEYDELVAGYQKGRSANERYQRAAAMTKQVNQLLERAKQGDLSWLTDLGVPDEVQRSWAEKSLLKHIEYENLSPEQKEILELKRAKEALEKEREEATKGERERKEAEIQARAFQDVDNDISKALQVLGKKATPRLVRRIAEQLAASIDLSPEDGERLTPEIAAKRAHQSLVSDAELLLSEMKPDEVMDLLNRVGKRDLVRRAFVDEATAQAPSRPNASKGDAPPPQRSRVKRMTTDEWFNRLDKKMGGPSR